MVILIIDSSIQIIEALANLLVETGITMEIYKAVNRNDGLSLFKAKQPAVVVLDWSLPDNKSVLLLKDILASGIKTTTIVLSNDTGKPAKQEYTLQGIDFILDKYNEFEKIPEIISNIAGKYPN